MTAEHYHALYRWFDAHPAARRFVVALDRWLPLVPFVCYPVLLCLLNVRLVQLFLSRQSAAPDLMPEIAPAPTTSRVSLRWSRRTPTAGPSRPGMRSAPLCWPWCGCIFTRLSAGA